MSSAIWFVIGTRPEATKGWLVTQEIAGLNGVRLQMLFSGQHTTLLEECLHDLGWTGQEEILAPLHAVSTFPGEWKSRLRDRLELMLQVERPALLCVLGDTDSGRIAAEVGAGAGLRIAHLEAGIRHRGQYEKQEPEELNRRQISKIANIHFAPTPDAAEALRREGIPNVQIVVSGDLSYSAVAAAFDGMVRRLAAGWRSMSDRTRGPYVVCTFHRSTSLWDIDRLTDHFCEAAAQFSELTFTVITRPDTRWRRFYDTISRVTNVGLMAALQPSLFLAEILQCEFVLTDSAGVQQEAIILGKRVIGCRRETELYPDHPCLLLVPPPFGDLPGAIGRLWPAERQAYRGDREPTLSLVRSEGIKIAKEIAWHIGRIVQ